MADRNGLTVCIWWLLEGDWSHSDACWFGVRVLVLKGLGAGPGVRSKATRWPVYEGPALWGFWQLGCGVTGCCRLPFTVISIMQLVCIHLWMNDSLATVANWSTVSWVPFSNDCRTFEASGIVAGVLVFRAPLLRVALGFGWGFTTFLEVWGFLGWVWGIVRCIEWYIGQKDGYLWDWGCMKTLCYWHVHCLSTS